MGTVLGNVNSDSKTYNLRNADGTASSAFRVTKKSNSKKVKKKLNYNFKDLSSRILRSKTAKNTKETLTIVRGKIAVLRQRLRAGEYDDEELKNAITHAEKMERAAKRKMKHLQEEEEIQKESKKKSPENDRENESLPKEKTDVLNDEMQEIKEERQEIDRLMEKMQKLMKEASCKTPEYEEDLFLSGELTHSDKNISNEELELLKKKNRSKEMREIMEADLKYLKSVFEKLSREKEEAVGSPVSLEIGGMDIPVAAEDAPVMTEGESMDVMV